MDMFLEKKVHEKVIKKIIFTRNVLLSYNS